MSFKGVEITKWIFKFIRRWKADESSLRNSTKRSFFKYRIENKRPINTYSINSLILTWNWWLASVSSGRSYLFDAFYHSNDSYFWTQFVFCSYVLHECPMLWAHTVLRTVSILFTVTFICIYLFYILVILFWWGQLSHWQS